MSFNLNCIMQLKQFYDIATKVSSRKSATTFGVLPDWWSQLLKKWLICCYETTRNGYILVDSALKCKQKIAQR